MCWEHHLCVDVTGGHLCTTAGSSEEHKHHVRLFSFGSLTDSSSHKSARPTTAVLIHQTWTSLWEAFVKVRTGVRTGLSKQRGSKTNKEIIVYTTRSSLAFCPNCTSPVLAVTSRNRGGAKVVQIWAHSSRAASGSETVWPQSCWFFLLHMLSWCFTSAGSLLFS